ncbi:hypothetical protein NLN93_26310 [Citrobacter portucalensis]|nr:hypothetical protein [Citrobacter portucalensis]
MKKINAADALTKNIRASLILILNASIVVQEKRRIDRFDCTSEAHYAAYQKLLLYKDGYYEDLF